MTQPTHVWVRHSGHGGYWQCPVDVLEAMRARGWERSDAPQEVDLATAERVAWEREQAQAAGGPEPATATTESTEAAGPGESSEESES